MLDIVPELAALLHNLVVTRGGHSVTFPFVSYGLHWAQPGDYISARWDTAAATADSGGGATQGTQRIQVFVVWGNPDSLTDPDGWRRDVVNAIEARIRTIEKGTGGAHFVLTKAASNNDEVLYGLTRTLAYGVVVEVEADGVEVYA